MNTPSTPALQVPASQSVDMTAPEKRGRGRPFGSRTLVRHPPKSQEQKDREKRKREEKKLAALQHATKNPQPTANSGLRQAPTGPNPSVVIDNAPSVVDNPVPIMASDMNSSALGLEVEWDHGRIIALDMNSSAFLLEAGSDSQFEQIGGIGPSQTCTEAPKPVAESFASLSWGELPGQDVRSEAGISQPLDLRVATGLRAGGHYGSPYAGNTPAAIAQIAELWRQVMSYRTKEAEEAEKEKAEKEKAERKEAEEEEMEEAMTEIMKKVEEVGQREILVSNEAPVDKKITEMKKRAVEWKRKEEAAQKKKEIRALEAALAEIPRAEVVEHYYPCFHDGRCRNTPLIMRCGDGTIDPGVLTQH